PAALPAVGGGGVERAPPHTRRRATARLAFLVPGRPGARELNAPPPAMPGYSDMAAGAFLDVVGKAAGLSPAVVRKLGAENGSNVEALYRALVTATILERGRPPGRIAILARRSDSQLTEVGHLARPFRQP